VAEQVIRPDIRATAKTSLICRLRHRTAGRWPSPIAGEVELENVSANVIEVEVWMHPLQYLNVVVRDSAGEVIPTSFYGDVFSPHEKPCTFRLLPGEKYTHSVSLLGTLPENKRLPGNYTAQAIYEYNGLKAVSEPVAVQVPAAGP
jgi:hypothetical protein